MKLLRPFLWAAVLAAAFLYVTSVANWDIGRALQPARGAIREIARVLRPGGLFVHETPVSQHLAHPFRSFGRTLPRQP